MHGYIKTPSKRKQTGSHYTPPELARLVAERLAGQVRAAKQPLRILDPACGDGSLLRAIANTLPKASLPRCTLIGIEHERDAFGALETALANCSACKLDLIRGDFLDFFQADALFGAERTLDPVDIIIANPPYVRTQVLGAERAQDLAFRFGLSGRVDLYQAFLVAMEKQLRPGGLLGVITSNRFLTTRSGASTRDFLRSHFDILEVVDLGDTKLFEAAVLPALVFAVKRHMRRSRHETAEFKFVRVYQEPGAVNGSGKLSHAITDFLREPKSGLYTVDRVSYRVATGYVEPSEDESQPWTMLTGEETDWAQQFNACAACRLGDVANIRVGVKTTADSVFIRRDWRSLPGCERPEQRFLRPLLSQDDAARWLARSTMESRKQVLYTHEVAQGRRRAIRFPENSPTWRYLLKNREKLEARTYVTGAGRQWYEIWVPQDPDGWQAPKLVFPDISPEPRFFLDREGCVVDGNCYWITTLDAADEDLLLLILGVANSKPMARYHDLKFQNKLYSQRRRHLTQYIQEYPLPNRELSESRQIVEAVRRLTSSPLSQGEKTRLEAKIDRLVAQAFGIATSSLATDTED